MKLSVFLRVFNIFERLREAGSQKQATLKFRNMFEYAILAIKANTFVQLFIDSDIVQELAVSILPLSLAISK